jgi:Meiotically up-regulated gene 113
VSALTIEDIRNPKRKSGFDHVTRSADTHRQRRTKNFLAKVYGRKGDGFGIVWQGPRRLTARESAQDYCDYVNSGAATPVPRVKSAGHSGRRSVADAVVNDSDYRAALGYIRDVRAQTEGKQGYVYCVGEAEGVAPLVKIGYSTNPEARVAELQTGNGRLLFLLGYFAGTMDDESKLHAKYLKDNTLQEWFRPSNELLSEFGFDLYDLYQKGSAALR